MASLGKRSWAHCSTGPRTNAVVVGVPGGVRLHELGGGEDDVAIFFERRAVGVLAVGEFGVVDRMRLLPDEERADRRGRFGAGRAGHLRPAGAGVALPLGGRFGLGQDALVVVEAALEHRPAIPEGEVDRVPPVHFEVELAFPTVVGEAGFLRREVARALDRGEILREDDAPFELAPARVAAAGEIDRAAGAPEVVPMFAREGGDGVEIGDFAVVGLSA